MERQKRKYRNSASKILSPREDERAGNLGKIFERFRKVVTILLDRNIVTVDMSYKPAYEHIPPATYGFLTKFYDFGCEVLGLGKSFKRKILDSVEITDGSIILDVGCGTGVFLEVAKRKFPNSRVIGIDPDEEALAIARARLNRQHLIAELIHGYAEALSLSDKSIDICFSTLAFHHIPDGLKQKAIEEIRRVLKPGGKVVIADFGPSSNPFLKLILGFEKHVKGNFQGLVIESLRRCGFRNIFSAGRKFPGLEILTAEK